MEMSHPHMTYSRLTNCWRTHVWSPRFVHKLVEWEDFEQAGWSWSVLKLLEEKLLLEHKLALWTALFDSQSASDERCSGCWNSLDGTKDHGEDKWNATSAMNEMAMKQTGWSN